MNRLCDRCLLPTQTKRLGRFNHYCFKHYGEVLRERAEATQEQKKQGYRRPVEE